MKVIAIPDLHLDKTFNVTYGDAKIWAAKPLQLVKHILHEEKPDKVIFLGDVFDTYHPSFHSIFSFLSTIQGYDVSVISGNHDIPKTKKKSIMDYLEKYVNIIPRNDIKELYEDNYGIGWCDTQKIFNAKIKATLDHMKGKYLFLHCAYNNWDNEMDNVISDSTIKMAKNKNIQLISGHEHISAIKQETLYHLGSIMPMNIGELGQKYYWTSDKGLKKINHGVGNKLTDDVILVRKSVAQQDNKPIVIKSGKRITSDDLVMEKKELTMDIVTDFIEQAIKEGFSEDFLKSVGFINE